MNRSKTWLMLAAFMAVMAGGSFVSASTPEEDFKNPPTLAKPGVWWHWMGANTSKEGITKDLEAMARVGIGGATIFGMADILQPDIVTIQNHPAPGPLVFSPDWWKLVRHAADQAERLGLEIGLHNAPGYETSGGPWVTAEDSMQDLIYTQTSTSGPGKFTGKLPRPEANTDVKRGFAMINSVTGKKGFPEIPERKTYYREVAVLAMPTVGTVKPGNVINLSAKLAADGSLDWDMPGGKWTIYRFGHTTAGALTGPTQPEVRSFEVDKMNPAAVERHLDHLLGVMKEHLGRHIGKTVSHVLIDSYEAGNATWTPAMPAEFLQRRGYDLTPWLPVFAGRTIESPQKSKLFQNQFNSVKYELHRDMYFAIFQRRLNAVGLKFQCEPYWGPFSIPDVMPYIDRPMTEFFSNFSDALAARQTLPIVAAARASGKILIEAEAFNPSLRKIARTPELPVCKIVSGPEPAKPNASVWLGATVRGLEGEEYSAFGVSKEDGGVQLLKVPAKGALASASLQVGDLIQGLNGIKVSTVRDLTAATGGHDGKSVPVIYVRQQSKRETKLAIP